MVVENRHCATDSRPIASGVSQGNCATRFWSRPRKDFPPGRDFLRPGIEGCRHHSLSARRGNPANLIATGHHLTRAAHSFFRIYVRRPVRAPFGQDGKTPAGSWNKGPGLCSAETTTPATHPSASSSISVWSRENYSLVRCAMPSSFSGRRTEPTGPTVEQI